MFATLPPVGEHEPLTVCELEIRTYVRFHPCVQLALDSLDRLVELLEEHGPLSANEAARSLFATSSISEGLACSLLAAASTACRRWNLLRVPCS